MATSFEMPHVLLKSGSPSSVIVPFFISTPMAVANACKVTPASNQSFLQHISPAGKHAGSSGSRFKPGLNIIE